MEHRGSMFGIPRQHSVSFTSGVLLGGSSHLDRLGGLVHPFTLVIYVDIAPTYPYLSHWNHQGELTHDPTIRGIRRRQVDGQNLSDVGDHPLCRHLGRQMECSRVYSGKKTRIGRFFRRAADAPKSDAEPLGHIYKVGDVMAMFMGFIGISWDILGFNMF